MNKAKILLALKLSAVVSVQFC
uniref:Uncharacterized protein n=1 Tax=Anguilla anguilla TaxID=7936 RepID=A0A0E9TXM5_ANGAN